MEEPRRHAIYLAPELSTIPRGSGAYRHIEIGLTELGREFSMDLIPKHCPQCQPHPRASDLPSRRPRFRRGPAWRGTLRDCYLIVQNLPRACHYVREIKRLKACFIYERAAYASCAGLLAARFAGIHHFYEVNGILSQDRSQYYESWLAPSIACMEKYFYSKSDHSFCVGGIHHSLGLGGSEFSTVQNGIEREFVDQFNDHHKAPQLPLKIVFVGQIMRHHRLDILFEAIGALGTQPSIEVTIIGSPNRNVQLDAPGNCRVAALGPVPHEQLPNLLKNFHVGVLLYADDYSSSMKVFAYAAAKLALMLPRARNMCELFSQEEAIFFENGDSVSLSRAFASLVVHPESIVALGERAHRRVAECYTWEKVFEEPRRMIREALAA
jgi:glycosyltransferase involved in cell wall biosynthesis